MIKRILITVVVMLYALSMSANLLDDKFEAISQIEGVEVQEALQNEQAKGNVTVAKAVFLCENEQAEAADALFNTISDEILFFNASSNGADMKGWLVEDNEQDATILLSIIFSSDEDDEDDEKVIMALFCKGPKSMLKKINVGE